MLGGYILIVCVAAFIRFAFRRYAQSMDNKEQVIKFSGNDPEPTFEVYSEKVSVVSAAVTGTNGISRIKSHNIVDYCWEEKFYTGQQLAVHRGGQYIAYGITGRGKTQFSVRVVHRVTSNRVLMKDAEATIDDLAFAQTFDEIILACVDAIGTLLVYKIVEEFTELKSQLLIHVLQPDKVPKGIPFRIFWCPCLPGDPAMSEDSDLKCLSKLFAVTRNTKLELWSVDMLRKSGGECTVIDGSTLQAKKGALNNGIFVLEPHTALITEVIYSPDAQAIATASNDGTCKFHQVCVNILFENGRCLHEWTPHDGRPVTLLLFLDDLRKFNPEIQFWKFAITGTADNTEIRLWSCETWSCLQEIRFTQEAVPRVQFKVGIDLSSSFIIMNDMANKKLFVLELMKKEEEKPYVCGITEMRLQFSILSFGIAEADLEKHVEEPVLGSLCNGDGADDITDVVIKMYIVQPKSLQLCNIVFPSAPKKYTINQNIINDLKKSLVEEKEEAVEEMDASVGDSKLERTEMLLPISPPPPALSLLTPDAFSNKPPSPAAQTLALQENVPPITSPSMTSNALFEEDLQELQTFPSLPVPSETKETEESSVRENGEVCDAAAHTSGGSSPSREVETILGTGATFQSNQGFPPQQEWTQPLPSHTILPTPTSVKSTNTERKPVSSDREERHQMVVEIISLKSELATLISLVKLQANEIQELRSELKISTQRKEEGEVTAAMNKWWAAHKGELAQQSKWDQDKAVSHICQLVDNSINLKLPSLVQTSMNNILNPAVKEMKDQIHTELTKKLTATDVLLKENITKLLKSKAMVEMLSNNLTNATKPVMNQISKDMVNEAVPKFEKVCSGMYKQISDTFNTGTAHYMAELGSQMKDFLDGGRNLLLAVKDSSTIISRSNEELSESLQKTVSKAEESLVDSVSRAVTMSVNSAMRNAMVPSGPRSRAETPRVPPVDLQAQLLSLVSQGQIALAFQQALSAADLSLVSLLCDKVPVTQVFSPSGCLLQQHVLLSLIQQLSADMSSYSDVKHRYLEEAVMNLDTSNLLTREHMPSVLAALNRQLVSYSTNYPSSPIVKRIKMLQTFLQSLRI